MIMSRITGALARAYDWLACADTPERCDAIFVLAGREYRKEYGLRLLQERWSEMLILSVARYEIRQFSKLQLPIPIDLTTAAATVRPEERHYFVAIRDENADVQRIKISVLGTMSEIRALALWLNANPWIRSAMVVSSAFHLRRVRLCCRSFIPESVRLVFVVAPGPEPWRRDTWWRRPEGLKLVSSEIIKLVVYSLWRRSGENASGRFSSQLQCQDTANVHKYWRLVTRSGQMQDEADCVRVYVTA